MPTTAESIFDGAEKKMSPSNEAVKINYIGDSGARVRLLAVRLCVTGYSGLPLLSAMPVALRTRRVLPCGLPSIVEHVDHARRARIAVSTCAAL